MNIFEKLVEVNPTELNTVDYVNLLFRFAMSHDILCLWGFYKWAKDHDYSKEKIAETFLHDLYGANDKFFAPRSEDYKKFAI